MRQRLIRVYAWLCHHRMARLHHLAHLGYFGAVAIETHYWYSSIAGGLLILGIVALVTGDD